MRFSYHLAKKKDYTAKSHQFPNIEGKGSTSEEAIDQLITKVFHEIRFRLDNDIEVPEDYNIKNKAVKSFGLPFNMALKIKLHNTRVCKAVSKGQLARYLALTYEEVPDGVWTTENLQKIQLRNAPKYKNVQRLFNIDHDSTVREIEQAFRVLGYNLDIIPYERK